ncbi:beta-microseminoprotein-like [Anomaloglossus baeobatrachus]|uniref:beta-microseminoprotein-like n=1 Tax=Anomaloglossus baeobatrachus TaxID=238106 RepID=UPI003F4FBCE3
MMKYSLVIVLFGAGIFVGACNAYCFIQETEGNPGGCILDGELHKSGSSFRTKDCLDCHCHSDGSMNCCNNIPRPVGYNQERCKEIFYKEACVHLAVRKDNPKKTCKHALVG